jgi:hypothetical protein
LKPLGQRLPPRWQLLLLGASSIALYGFGISMRYPLMAGLRTPNGNWNTLVAPSWLQLAIQCGVYLALTICYLLAIRLLNTHPTPSRANYATIIGTWVLASVSLFASYPGGESHDVFDYLFRGRIFLDHNASPLAITPDQFPGAPYFAYISWDKHVDTYGPLWEYASLGIAWIVRSIAQSLGIWEQIRPSCPISATSCTILAGYITGYRLLATCLHGIGGWLIWLLVGSVEPKHAPGAVLLWLWNPVAIIASALGAHNDGLMLIALLGMFLCIQRQRWLLALLLLGMAAHVKLTALLFAPALAIWMFQRLGIWRSITLGLSSIGLLLPISWLLYAPLGGWQTLPRMLHERGLYFANSPATILYRWLYEELGWRWVDAVQTTNQSATIGFLIALGIIVWKFWHSADNTSEQLWHTQTVIIVAYLLIGCFWFQHWYLVWALVSAALIPNRFISHTLLPWYGCGALCANIANGMLAGMPELAMSYKGYALIATTLSLAPILVTISWLVMQRYRRETCQVLKT